MLGCGSSVSLIKSSSGHLIQRKFSMKRKNSIIYGPTTTVLHSQPSVTYCKVSGLISKISKVFFSDSRPVFRFLGRDLRVDGLQHYFIGHSRMLIHLHRGLILAFIREYTRARNLIYMWQISPWAYFKNFIN